MEITCSWGQLQCYFCGKLSCKRLTRSSCLLCVCPDVNNHAHFTVPPQLYECKTCPVRITIVDDVEPYTGEAEKILEKYNQANNETHSFKVDRVEKVFAAVRKSKFSRLSVFANIGNSEITEAADWESHSLVCWISCWLPFFKIDFKKYFYWPFIHLHLVLHTHTSNRCWIIHIYTFQIWCF